MMMKSVTIILIWTTIRFVTAISTNEACTIFNMNPRDVSDKTTTPLEVAEYFNENDGHKGIKVFQMNQEYFNYVTMFYAKEDDFPIVLNYGFQDPTQVCGYEFAIPFETIGTQQQQSPISWSFEAKSNGAWVKLHVFRASEDEVFNSRSRAFSLDNPGRYQDYRFVITETTTGKLSTVQFWRVEVHGLITPMMRNKIQQEEKSIERSSVDEETMKNDWPNRGDDQSDGWPVDGDRNNEKASALKRDVTSVERDIESVVDVDGGGHAVLLMGLAVLFIGFIVIRFKQSRPMTTRRRHNNMSVQRPPDGTFEVGLDRAHHGEL